MTTDKMPNWLTVTRLVVGVVVIIVGVFTQFDVTVKQEVTKPKIVRVEVPPAKLVEKAGTIPEADCYALAKNPRGVTERKLLDTYGTPKGDDGVGGILVYPLAEDEDRYCSLSTWGDDLTSVRIDLLEWDGY